ncbi:mannitol dehydrogenase family protein [Jannaschia sp. LMIT008]|uniref:mannitol dehydrogenase family protein n=1 Tax=Jannaschia maritima TaxID=3032585 RepID=UPI0028123772|nr:mannitol dehydrogenase family protein [Jannaschia sp. LMIT008]
MNRIVHLGLGAFHRAHGAHYVHRANAATGTGWRIHGVSFRSAGVRDALAADGWRYVLEVADADGRRPEVVDVLDGVTVLPEKPDALRGLLADPAVSLVTLTVTEKGYHLRGNGRADLDALAEDVAALRDGRPGRTVPGALLDALRHRDAPLTVLSCDNLPDNGAALRGVLLSLADAAGVERGVVTRHAYPSSMVDRITPAADDALRDRMRAAGLPHAAPVATEAFTEWVVEDRFAGPMPDIATAGARIVPDVAPHEMRKLRMLNGAHSTLAYAGLNAGHAFVHEAVADPDLRAVARAVMAEAAATLPQAVQGDAPAYADALIERFENPHLAHRLDQIAIDGSRKLPIRILGTRRDHDGPTPACDRALREWTAWLDATFAAGGTPDDPAADVLRAGRAAGHDAERLLEDAA